MGVLTRSMARAASSSSSSSSSSWDAALAQTRASLQHARGRRRLAQMRADLQSLLLSVGVQGQDGKQPQTNKWDTLRRAHVFLEMRQRLARRSQRLLFHAAAASIFSMHELLSLRTQIRETARAMAALGNDHVVLRRNRRIHELAEMMDQALRAQYRVQYFRLTVAGDDAPLCRLVRTFGDM